ncbi:hypothetical protein WR25_13120 [Diploscapter pachys]|uniref:G-protein alpha subunit n=1 Tax=Diploscapter pachys TaxID=2018661 RepID=A0A2A2LPQ9_9BILA|nr:hypothetical protein WR25_13120 [Diploscapter pachys]
MLYDVGGQRSERRKWLFVFDNVDAIIFIVAVSEYDQVLKEDATTNRLYEAIELYRSIAASNYFIDTSIILFLNKKDLLEAKVGKVPIKNYFKDYEGENTFEDGIRYFRRRFDRATVGRQKRPYFHITQATDTRQIEVVISCVLDAIIQENLKDTGMV